MTDVIMNVEYDEEGDTTETTLGSVADASCGVYVRELTVDQRSDLRAQLALQDKRDAYEMRNMAASLRIQADEFEKKADLLDPLDRAHVAAEKPRVARKPRAAAPAKRAPKAKMAPRPVSEEASVGSLPTEKQVLEALSEPIGIGALAEQLGCDKSKLMPILIELMTARRVKRTGERRGTKYQAK